MPSTDVLIDWWSSGNDLVGWDIVVPVLVGVGRIYLYVVETAYGWSLGRFCYRRKRGLGPSIMFDGYPVEIPRRIDCPKTDATPPDELNTDSSDIRRE